MSPRARAAFTFGCLFLVLFPLAASSQNGSDIDQLALAQIAARPPRQAPAAPRERAKPRPKKIARRELPPLPVAAPTPPTEAAPKAQGLVAAVTLADMGFVNGLHFANLGGHRELYVPLPPPTPPSAI
jgi:hypothetical protein